MALAFMDGFEQYGSDCPTSKRYPGNNVNIVSPGRFSYGQCLRFQGESPVFAWGGASSDLVFGFAMMCSADSFTSGQKTMMEFLGNGANNSNRQFSMGSWPDGSLGIMNDNNSSAVLCRSAAGVLTLDAWCYVELLLHHDAASDTGGSCEIYVNGVSVASATGVKMRANGNWTPDGVQLVFRYQTFIDDLYVLTGTLTPLGDSRVLSLPPTSDVAAGWTPSTGSNNYAVVDELPWNVSDYVSAAAASTVDSYGLTDLPYTPASIFGVQISYYAQKDDATARTIRSKMLSGATTVSGATRTMNAGFAIFNDVPLVLDPNTSAAWTATAINALNIGLEVVT